jgi:ubiquinone/menaquinone biosynthesis C-methylase UbiE
VSDALDAVRRKAESTYNAAADHFDDEPLAFWERYGRRTVERLAPPAGGRVLDVCCGTGASALPAARAVGPTGKVIAVDLAGDLLERGRAKARAAGLDGLEFRRGDMTALGFPDGSFDAVICVFGIFFVPDMERQVAELWRMVRPGGRLAITTWGPDLFAPANEMWNDAVRRVRPDLHAAFNPWDRITTPDAVRALMAAGGAPDASVEPEEGHQTLRSADDVWTIALGSGLRWTIDQMGPGAAADVRREMVGRLVAARVDRVSTGVIYALARKPAGARA